MHFSQSKIRNGKIIRVDQKDSTLTPLTLGKDRALFRLYFFSVNLSREKSITSKINKIAEMLFYTFSCKNNMVKA